VGIASIKVAHKKEQKSSTLQNAQNLFGQSKRHNVVGILPKLIKIP